MFATAHRASTRMCGSASPRTRMVLPRKEKSLPFVWRWRPSRRTPQRLPAGTPRSGRGGAAKDRLRKRRGWPFLIEQCCSSPARSNYSEMPRLWPGTAQQQGTIRRRTSCGPRTKPGASLARSTRRSSSPLVVRMRPPKRSLAPCRWEFDECATENRRRSIATLPSVAANALRVVRRGGRTGRASGPAGRRASGRAPAGRTGRTSASVSASFSVSAWMRRTSSWSSCSSAPMPRARSQACTVRSTVSCQR